MPGIDLIFKFDAERIIRLKLYHWYIEILYTVLIESLSNLSTQKFYLGMRLKKEFEWYNWNIPHNKLNHWIAPSNHTHKNFISEWG